jgi:hypothetical protein
VFKNTFFKKTLRREGNLKRMEEEKYFIALIESWMSILTIKGYKEAYLKLGAHVSYENISIDDFQTILGERQLTTIDKMDSEYAVIRIFEHDNGVNIEYSLPLDGKWSPLTAIFEFYKIQNKWTFSLVELDEF